jgi:hypothetical protein
VDWLCLHEVYAPRPLPAATAIAIRVGYRIIVDLVPEYQRLAAATAGSTDLQGIIELQEQQARVRRP